MNDEEKDLEVQIRMRKDGSDYATAYNRVTAEGRKAQETGIPRELVSTMNRLSTGDPSTSDLLRLRRVALDADNISERDARARLEAITAELIAKPPVAGEDEGRERKVLTLRTLMAGCGAQVELREFLQCTNRRTEHDLRRAKLLAVKLQAAMRVVAGDAA